MNVTPMRSRRLVALALPTLLMLASAACNALVGFGGLQRVDDETSPDGAVEVDAGKPRRDGSTSEPDGDVPDTSEPIAPRCDPTKPFGAPTRVEEFVEPQDSAGAVLRSDEKEAYYVSFTGNAIRRATRNTRDEPWTVTTITLSKKGSAASLTSDGLKMYLLAESGIAYNVATRPTIEQSFSTATSITLGSTLASPSLFVANTDDHAYFSRKAGTDAVIAVATLADLELDSTSAQVDGLAHVSGKQDDYPVLNRDETVIYFYSERAGGRAWRAERASKTQPFSAPVALTEFNGEFDMVTWVSDDDCLVYMDRQQFIWRAQRPK